MSPHRRLQRRERARLDRSLYREEAGTLPIELLSTAGVAKVLGTNARRVLQLAGDREDFPEPYAVVRHPRRDMRLWLPEDVEAWARTANRRSGGAGHRR